MLQVSLTRDPDGPLRQPQCLQLHTTQLRPEGNVDRTLPTPPLASAQSAQLCVGTTAGAGGPLADLPRLEPEQGGGSFQCGGVLTHSGGPLPAGWVRSASEAEITWEALGSGGGAGAGGGDPVSDKVPTKGGPSPTTGEICLMSCLKLLSDGLRRTIPRWTQVQKALP